MAMAILLIVLAGLSFAGIAALYSLAARRRFAFASFAALGCALAVGVLAVIRVNWSAVAAGQVPRAPLLLTVFTLVGVINVASFLTMHRAMRAGHHGVIWTVSQSALVAPFAFNVLVCGEPATLSRLLALGCILAGIAAFGQARREDPPAAAPGTPEPVHWFMLALLCFGLLGAAQVLVTVPAHWPGWTDTARLRAAVLLVAGALGNAAAAPLRHERPRRRIVPWAFLLAAIIVAGHIALFEGLDRMGKLASVSIAYPVAVGTSIVAFGLYSRLALHERLEVWHGLGLALCLAGVAMMCL